MSSRKEGEIPRFARNDKNVRAAFFRRPMKRVLLFQERAFLQLQVRFLELLLRVHDDGAVPGHGLFQRFSGDEEETDAFVAGLHHDLVALIEEHERAVFRGGGRRGVRPADRLGRHRKWIGGVAEFCRAREHVGERMARRLDGQSFSLAGRHGNVKINGVGGDAVDRAGLSPEFSADQANVRAIVVRDHREFPRLSLPGSAAASS